MISSYTWRGPALYFMTNNILVTGVKGFVGSNFALQANTEKFNVIGLSWTRDKWNADDYKNYLYKITQDIELESVVHLGAIASTRFVDKKILNGFNVEAVKIIADFCVSKKTPLVFASSAAIYGNSNDFLSPYAISKQQGESIIKSTDGLSFAALRLFNAYGFNEIEKKEMKSVISDMIISGLRHKKISIWKFDKLAPGLQSRDFVNVLDVSRVILKLIMSSTYPNEPLDLGSGQSYKFIDLAKFISSIDPKIVIEFTDPPEEYNEKFYQKYTCADMSWLETFNMGIKPFSPYEKIPSLIEQYKKILDFGDLKILK